MSISTSPMVAASRREVLLARFIAYCELSKPRIAALVLVVVAVSAFVGSSGAMSQPAQPWVWIHALIGTLLIATSAGAFNQAIERRSDALMERTIDRPLPAGRLHLSEVVTFGFVTLAAGFIYLFALVNPLTALLGALTWFSYVVIYTPLKSRTAANTAIGAVAGAMPVLIGWAAVGGSFSLSDGPMSGGLRVGALFLIVYLWQFPHFMAIAWIYRRQYAAAGMKMLTVVEPTGRRAGAQAILAALALVPVSLLAGTDTLRISFAAGALMLGLAYFAASVWFCLRRDERAARTLLQVSLVYLPALLAALVWSAA